MSSAELKAHLHQLIDGITDNSVLKAVHTLLSRASDDQDWWDELSDSQKESVRKGLEDYKNGNVHTSEQVKSELSKKYPQLRF